MREEWVFILSTCAAIVKLRGLWCDMTGDCFKCPHQRNGWTCLGVTTQKLFIYITCWFSLWVVNSCGTLPKQTECASVCVSWYMRVYIDICWCVHMQAGVPRGEVMCVNVSVSPPQRCMYELLYCLYISSLPWTHLLAAKRCTEIKRILHQCDSEAKQQ